ncbi:MAG: glycosyltransferase [archaeon]|nr:glycosyltransferase [archaeon]MCP8314319.1 glycosyltransferase [archaeon]MCP8319495.1 glycosyltransferase [archaeon]
MLYHAGRGVLNKVLEAIGAIDYQKKRICLIFIDNMSKNGSSDLVDKWLMSEGQKYLEIKHLCEPGNVPCLRNICLNLALEKGCDYLMFVDSDVIITQDSVKRLLELFNLGEDVFISSLPYYAPIERDNLFIRVRMKYGKGALGPPIVGKGPISVVTVGMGATMIKLSLVSKVGFFDEEIPWIEDLNYTRRATSMGYKIMYDTSVALLHDKDVKTSSYLKFVIMKMGKSEVRNMIKNKLWKKEVRGLAYWSSLMISIPLILITPLPFFMLFLLGYILYSIRMRSWGKIIGFPVIALYRMARTLGMIYGLLYYMIKRKK